jgi:hypothetical protein
MKRTLLVALAILCVGALAAGAQSYKLEFSGNTSVSSCELASGGVGVSSVHVILTGSGGVTALLFGAQIPACWAGTTWIRDNLALPVIYPSSQEDPAGDFWLAIGDTQDPLGLSIAFRECKELPLYIGTIEFMGAAPAPCCEFAVTHPPYWTSFSTPAQVVDCSFNEHDTAGGSVKVSSGPTCPCQHALATEQSTWGRVKALYR